jgi:hypothetical protein
MASFNQTQQQPMQSMQVSWKSLYIPVLPKDMLLDGEPLFDEASMKKYFEEKEKLGKVSRVDYVSKQMPNGTTKISAFIHFDYWYENACEFIHYITANEEVKLAGYKTRQFNCITSSSNRNVRRFFSVRINKTPIPEVKQPELNVHQLIASNQFMEKLIEEQKVKMAEMEAELAELKSKMSSSTDNVTVTNNIPGPFDEEKNTDNMAAYASLYLRETTLMY